MLSWMMQATQVVRGVAPFLQEVGHNLLGLLDAVVDEGRQGVG